MLIVICLIVSSGKQEMSTAKEIPGCTLLTLSKRAFLEAAEICRSVFRKPTPQ